MAADADRPLDLTFETVPVTKPDTLNVIIGQSHFIKTVDDLHEALAIAQVDEDDPAVIAPVPDPA